MYASSEAAVAKVLLAIRGSSYGMQPIWDVVSSFRALPPGNPVNLEAFWDRWRLLRSATFSSEQAALESIFSERGIYYEEDQYEAAGDDTYTTTRTAALPLSETQYLYKADGAPDKDVVRFTALQGQQFTVQTTNMYNGADTYLTILNETGAPVYTNDNLNNASYKYCDSYCPANDTNNLRSMLTFTASADGTYYVEVSTSADIPPSAGRYGTYTLTITSP